MSEEIKPATVWGIFDFGHVANQKELKEALQAFSKSADESTRRLALKVIGAVNS